eukprot:TRINITY_DN103378_c0_g1_i1.p1 TRINITY_DN103378_c0_g1~~TRINITY_DN103378_c0_g1_i1.p1  ORF type:complete len:302 (-),score=17.29 TRINITY_DN103378_c0_g1_i1:279-1061(-)
MARSTMPEVQTERFIQFVSNMKERRSSATPLSVLSVGSGTGVLDQEWAGILAESFDLKDYDALEPNTVHIPELQRTLATMESNINGLQTHLLTTTFENAPHTKQYDLILFVHSAHWLTDAVDSISKARRLLTTSGCILIILQSQLGVPRLYDFMAYYKGDSKASLTAEELCSALDAEGICHKVYYAKATINVSECVSLQPQGVNVLSFMLNCDLNTIQPQTKLMPLIEKLQDCAVQAADGSLFIEEPIAFVEVETSCTTK